MGLFATNVARSSEHASYLGRRSGSTIHTCGKRARYFRETSKSKRHKITLRVISDKVLLLLVKILQDTFFPSPQTCRSSRDTSSKYSFKVSENVTAIARFSLGPLINHSYVKKDINMVVSVVRDDGRAVC